MATRAEHAKRKGRSSSQLLRPEKRQRIYARDGHRCLWCKRHAAEPGVKLTIDHYQPRSMGGDNATSNLLTACSECNFKRQDKNAIRWSRDIGMSYEDLIKLRFSIRRTLPKYVP
jgi:5-methylcytosine-specific restriction endonuclease McrA